MTLQSYLLTKEIKTEFVKIWNFNTNQWYFFGTLNKVSNTVFNNVYIRNYQVVETCTEQILGLDKKNHNVLNVYVRK